MRKSLIVACSTLFLAVGAVPAAPELGYDFSFHGGTGGPYEEAVSDGGADDKPAMTYRPCRPGPGDDRCIQLYERGVREAYARWQRERGGTRHAQAEPAMGGPIEQRTDYSPCSSTLTDECIQRFDDAPPPPATTRRQPGRDGPSTPGI